MAIACVVVLAAATGSSTAWAKWGCAARGAGNTWANNFSYDNETEARSNAVDVCERVYTQKHPGGHVVCHIIGCNAHIDTQEQSLAKYPAPSAIDLRCGPKFGNKC